MGTQTNGSSQRSSWIKVYFTLSPCDNESVAEAARDLSAASLTKSTKSLQQINCLTLELRAFYVNERGPVVLHLKGWNITG